MKVCPHCSGAYPVAEGFCPMDGTRLRTLHAEGRAHVPVSNAYADAMLGTVLDRRYRLDALIGEGGMGLVFRATHVLIGKPLAIKLLRREHLDAPDVARRFLLEARVASSLKHPNVVDISDFGEIEGGGAYYVMELLEGRTLAQTIDREGPRTAADAVVIAAQICAGLSAAHAHGVVHRDLKPDNVFLCDPRHGAEHALVKLLDFGIARAGPRRITVTGAVLGTPEYMSPEMAQGFDVDHRADFYALGVILFELLTGSVPFYNKEISKTLEMHVFAPRPTIASRKPELARLVRIGELVESLMAIEPSQRPIDAEDVLRSLRDAWAHDLDAEAIAVVQRATLAIGSNRMPQSDPPRAAQWPAPSPWPAARAIPEAPDPSPHDGGPEPAPVVVRGPSSTRRGGAAPVLIAVSTAAVACAITLGIAKWVQTSATAAELPREDAPFEQPAAVDDPPREPTRVAQPADDPTSRADRTVEGPKALGAGVEAQASPATPPLPEVIPVASEPAASDEKSVEVVDRSNRRRKRPADPTSPPSAGTTPTSTTPPPAHDPPRPPNASDPEPTPPPVVHRGPADLKDPFPTK